MFDVLVDEFARALESLPAIAFVAMLKCNDTGSLDELLPPEPKADDADAVQEAQREEVVS